MKRTLATWLLPAAALPLGCAFAYSDGESRPRPAIDTAAATTTETATFALG
jgi:hypothetical protein